MGGGGGVDDACAQAEPKLNRAGTFQANTCCFVRSECTVFSKIYVNLFLY